MSQMCELAITQKSEKDLKKAESEARTKAIKAARIAELETIVEDECFYLKCKKTGIIYDFIHFKKGMEISIGNWNETSNKIVFDIPEDGRDEFDF